MELDFRFDLNFKFAAELVISGRQLLQHQSAQAGAVNLRMNITHSVCQHPAASDL